MEFVCTLNEPVMRKSTQLTIVTLSCAWSVKQTDWKTTPAFLMRWTQEEQSIDRATSLFTVKSLILIRCAQLLDVIQTQAIRQHKTFRIGQTAIRGICATSTNVILVFVLLAAIDHALKHKQHQEQTHQQARLWASLWGRSAGPLFSLESSSLWFPEGLLALGSQIEAEKTRTK
jgi:hypothetical protein